MVTAAGEMPRKVRRPATPRPAAAQAEETASRVAAGARFATSYKSVARTSGERVGSRRSWSESRKLAGSSEEAHIDRNGRRGREADEGRRWERKVGEEAAGRGDEDVCGGEGRGLALEGGGAGGGCRRKAGS